jgi:hypothetical protein
MLIQPMASIVSNVWFIPIFCVIFAIGVFGTYQITKYFALGGNKNGTI